MSLTPNSPADFTPALGGYNSPKTFKFWCQKVLPLVYDDSLSYYELLCKVVEYLNETIEDVDTAVTDVTNLHTAYEQLQSYVNTYFDSLDVQQEINNKLDAMVEDGTFNTLLAPYMASYQTQLDLLDTRLTNLVTDYTPGDTTANAELADIRVAFDTETYDSAGNAVRGQINTVLNKIYNMSERTANLITCETGRFYVKSSGTIDESSANYYGMNDMIPATNAVTVRFWGAFESGSGTIYSAWYDSTKTFIERNNITKAAGSCYTTLTPPEGGAYVTACVYKSGGVSGDTKMMIVSGSDAPSDYIYYLDPVDVTAKNAIKALEDYGLQVYNDTYTDLNNFTVIGAIVTAYSKTYTNAPNNKSGTRLIINFASYSGAIRYQLYFNHSKAEAYTRIYSSNSWGDWKSLFKNVEDRLDSIESGLLWNESKESTYFSNDYFSSSEGASNTGDHVRIMEYNVAQYDNDTETKIDTLPNKLKAFKKLIMFVNADIISTCEDAEYIDSSSTKATKNYLYYPIYKYKRGAGGAGIYTKKTPTSGGDVSLPNGGTVRRVYYPVGSKTLVIYTMHCSVTSQQIRETQISELWDVIEADNPTYFVVAGDMNTRETGEPTSFKTFWEGKGCTLANGGYLGWLNTHKNDKALDNIVVSSNIIIENFEVLQNWYTDLYSDHYPIFADLVLL